MKKINRSEKGDSKKQAVAQARRPSGKIRIEQILDLTPEQTEALFLVAAWESHSSIQYLRCVLFASLKASFDDMTSAALADRTSKGKSHTATRKWAQRFHSRVALLMPLKGWEA
jgi:hypothetical protein